MRFAFTLAFLVATFLSSCTSFTGAEGFELANQDVPAHDTEAIDLTDIVRRLRGRHKLQDEERMLPANHGALLRLAKSNSLNSVPSSKILDAVKAHKPLPKWVKALLVVGGLASVGGSIYAIIKAVQNK
ncbi:hypothetical protein PHYPSEUDO_003935 [Phytophthora pseudosyringae]|uniref:RxLR effector protein n=1 Tax=Phytophthora pseudosyringae TaxID=221518 RepID=A0A8T1VQ12_9STRA|nr:hypothetical protein PHYPSEUDO_003935 [Phytophthora pseudosyringae]